MKLAVLPVTPFQQNCSVVWCEDTMTGAVIDPGGDVDEIQRIIAENGVTVEKIWATHGHIDHVGGAKELARRLQVPIEGPQEEDLFWIERMGEESRQFDIAGAEPFIPDRWLGDGDQVSVGTLTMDVIHCPGHTPGHVVFHEPELKLAFVGDVLFQGSIGRTDFPRSDHAALISSIKDKLWPLGNETTFIPGHGPASTFGDERRTNPFVRD
jgi:glyoxylase-like metal-dependent hydrolase (beta-lactamase superfamily II)